MQKYFILPIFAAVMSALWGCSNDENMGGDLVPPTDKSSIHVIDTISIRACTLQEDTVYSGNPTYLIAGMIDDPIFGTAEASFAAKFSNTSYEKFYANSVVDSMVLSLGLDTKSRRFYGDSLETVTLSAYRLTDSLSYGARYYQNFDISSIVDPTPVASVTFVPSVSDTLVRMVLSNDYAYSVIKNCLDSTFDANCGGLYFKIESKNCLVRFSPSSKFTEYSIYHHAKGDTSVNAVSFSISEYDPSLNMSSHDYSKSKFYGLLQNPGFANDGFLYLQGMCGTKIKLDFPNLKKLGSIGDSRFSIITSARLLMPVADSADVCEGLYPTINYVVMSGNKNDGKGEFFYPDFGAVQQNAYGSAVAMRNSYSLDYKNRMYTVDFTAAIKTMLEDCGSELAPPYSLVLSSSGRVTDFSRSVICSPSNPDRPMKLVIEYMSFEK